MFYLFDDRGRVTHSTPVCQRTSCGSWSPSFTRCILGIELRSTGLAEAPLSAAIFQAHFYFFWGSRDISQSLSTAWNYVLDHEHWKPLLYLMQRTFTYYGICYDNLMKVYSVKWSNQVNSYFHFFTCWYYPCIWNLKTLSS